MAVDLELTVRGSNLDWPAIFHFEAELFAIGSFEDTDRSPSVKLGVKPYRASSGRQCDRNRYS